MSKYGAFSGPYFPVFSPNTGKYGPEKTPSLNAFHAVLKKCLLIVLGLHKLKLARVLFSSTLKSFNFRITSESILECC